MVRVQWFERNGCECKGASARTAKQVRLQWCTCERNGASASAMVQVQALAILLICHCQPS
eukprot:12624969-Alexandrium_andersonii.AAC.1